MLKPLTLWLLLATACQAALVGDRDYTLKTYIVTRFMGKLKSLGQSPRGYEADPFYHRREVRSTMFFIATNLAPCDPVNEYTMMEASAREHYYCAEKSFIESNLAPAESERPLSIGDLEWIDEKDRGAAKTYYLNHLGRTRFGWASQPGGTPPVGLYFYIRFPTDVSGPFDSKFENGKAVGYEKLSEAGTTELPMNKKYFLVDPLPPCDAAREYTIREKMKKGYYCIAREKFELLFYEDLETHWAAHIYGDDLQYASPETQKKSAAIMKKFLPNTPIDFSGRGKKIAAVNPFEHVPEEMDKPFRVQIFEFTNEEVKNGYLVSYKGTLFGLCGDQCKLQGYTVLMDATGKVVKFLNSNLAQTASEYDIAPEGLERMRNLVNDEGKKLTELFRTSSFNSEYSAKMSKATELWGAGNSVGTFLLQITAAREAIRDRPGVAKDWPKFEWKLK